MNDYTAKLEKLKEENRRNETEKIKLEERLKSLKEEKDNLLVQLIDYDVSNISALEDTIEKLKIEIDAEFRVLEGE